MDGLTGLLFEPLGPGYVVRQFIQVEELADLPPTPHSWRDAGHTAVEAEIEHRLIALAKSIGEVLCWPTQQAGRAIHNVLPSPGDETKQIGSSSAVELTMHTEDSFHPFRPDVLLLLCLRNPTLTATTVCSADDVRAALSDPVAAILSEARFAFEIDISHEGSIGSADPVPIFAGTDAGLSMRVDLDYCRTYRDGDSEAQLALDELAVAIGSTARDVALRPGQLLAIDNSRCIHGRREFAANYDGNDRWLKRVLVSRSLDAARSAGYCVGNQMSLVADASPASP